MVCELRKRDLSVRSNCSVLLVDVARCTSNVESLDLKELYSERFDKLELRGHEGGGDDYELENGKGRSP
eukprot:8032132-Heterocapsa_arctica.AAC.1